MDESEDEEEESNSRVSEGNDDKESINEVSEKSVRV